MKTALELVRELFVNAQNENLQVLRDVWKIVTALRGPDSDNLESKSKYTTPIRMCVLNNTQAFELGLSHSESYPIRSYNSILSLDDVFTSDEFSHFKDHIRMADEAIQNSLKNLSKSSLII